MTGICVVVSEDKLFTISSFDEALEYAADLIGSDFRKALNRSQLIAEDASSFTGPVALVEARRLASYRVQIGIAAQQWKLKSANTKKPHDRLIKDALMCMYDGLLELINTLKLQVRVERDTINS